MCNKTCEKYDPHINSWSDAPILNIGRSGACASTFDDMFIYVFGGMTGNDNLTPVPEIEVFSIENNVWKIISISESSIKWVPQQMSQAA
jgi:hypothetical protein